MTHYFYAESIGNCFYDFPLVANYHWTPSSKRSQPSEYLVDLIAYLQGAFIAFDSLPVSYDVYL